MAVPFLFASLVLVAGVGFYATISSVNVTGRDIAWLAATTHTSPAEDAVYRRYLERHRRHRLAGGLAGACFAVVVGIRYYGSVSIGIGQGNPLADVLFCGLAGVLVGALSAESFRLSEPPATTVAASLGDRGIRVDPRLVHAARALAVAAVIVGALVAASGNGVEALAVAVVGLGVAGIAEATRRAIADRRRPLLSETARTVDVAIRSFAARSVALLQLAAAVLVAGWVASKTPFGDAAPLQLLQFGVVTGCLVATIVLLHRAAPRPPRGWGVDRLA
jgi:hypothetical protein